MLCRSTVFLVNKACSWLTASPPLFTTFNSLLLQSLRLATACPNAFLFYSAVCPSICSTTCKVPDRNFKDNILTATIFSVYYFAHFCCLIRLEKKPFIHITIITEVLYFSNMFLHNMCPCTQNWGILMLLIKCAATHWWQTLRGISHERSAFITGLKFQRMRFFYFLFFFLLMLSHAALCDTSNQSRVKTQNSAVNRIRVAGVSIILCCCIDLVFFCARKKRHFVYYYNYYRAPISYTSIKRRRERQITAFRASRVVFFTFLFYVQATDDTSAITTREWRVKKQKTKKADKEFSQVMRNVYLPRTL